VVISREKLSDGGLEDDLESQSDTEAWRTTKSLKLGDVSSVEAKKVGNFFL